jgi:hypothetical protein
VVVTYLPPRKQRTVLERNSLLQSVELRTRLVVFFSHPVEVAAFFASVAEETGLFAAVEAEGFVAVNEFINLVDALALKLLLNDQPEVVR